MYRKSYTKWNEKVVRRTVDKQMKIYQNEVLNRLRPTQMFQVPRETKPRIETRMEKLSEFPPEIQ